MRLSEAIRLGATMGPQVFGSSHDRRGRMCAGFGAMKAAGYQVANMDQPDAPEFLRRVFPIWYEDGVYPGKKWESAWFRSTIGSIIIALNDHDRWDRERIADWVEQEEQLRTVKPIEREATDLVGIMVDEVLVYAPQ